MDRREAIKTAVMGGALVMLGSGRALAKVYNPVEVDEKLWRGINRIQSPADETGLGKLHSPVIHAPEKVKAGEAFTVDVAIGRMPHPMGPKHWIENLQFNIGNEPAGSIFFQSHGYVQPAGKFNAVLGKELKGKTVSLIVQIKCNLHGIWENHVNVQVA